MKNVNTMDNKTGSMDPLGHPPEPTNIMRETDNEYILLDKDEKVILERIPKREGNKCH